MVNGKINEKESENAEEEIDEPIQYLCSNHFEYMNGKCNYFYTFWVVPSKYLFTGRKYKCPPHYSYINGTCKENSEYDITEPADFICATGFIKKDFKCEIFFPVKL